MNGSCTEHTTTNTFATTLEISLNLQASNFGDDFVWGVSTSAPQTEGTFDGDGRGSSIWDSFSKLNKRIEHNHKPDKASEFYVRFQEDLDIVQGLNIPNFRFSFSWSRIFPEGRGRVNHQGLDFYHRLIDECLARNIEPWVTLYHWDLPEALEHLGGWVNRDVLGWFEDYVSFCTREFKDKVKHWMVLNEPMVFTGAGYYLGVHAPGKKGLKNFLAAVHHTALCQALGSHVIKSESPDSEVGSTFSCSAITPRSHSEKDFKAAQRIDALLNRMFVEAAIGRGYPFDQLPFLRRIEGSMKDGDEKRMLAAFDFAGIQVYTREVVSHSFLSPTLKAKLIPAPKRKVYHTAMDWEVYPESIYHIIKQFNNYSSIPKIYLTENGAAFHDTVELGRVKDAERIHYIERHLAQVLRAKRDGLKIDGYFVWSLTDNFEWAKGYTPRFGLVHVDYTTQKRTIKDSGYWYRDFLSS